jgi:hypothetical protein
MNGFSAKIGSIVPLGRGYFSHDPRHFVPGYDRAVPSGQNTLDRRGFAYGVQPWEPDLPCEEP